ncbi:MAG TPA: hypothetical protein PLU95_06510 [Syntrophales bacterium]|nr:hypothetical protein [Syntrophales bacterium]HPN08936.1 hypothetical protein [Syntrophales bacterium]HPX80592.1 hypothetical protein [Syntrophales bacterium]
MDKSAFGEFLTSLCHYYERKEPRKETLNLWFQEVKPLPEEPLDWIREQICQRQEGFPRNLPVIMRELWQRWREEHPQKQAHPDTDANCRDCDGTGLITGYRESHAYAFRCGRCRQSTLHGIPFTTVETLIAQGYERSAPRQGRQRAYG